jgi:rod shape-determining protein MreC
MESVLGRYRNLIILVAVLFAQVVGLGVQVRRNSENESSRLIRIWTVSAVTPFEKGLVWVQSSCANLWHNYFYLRGVRAENRQLKAEIERLRLEQVRLSGDAEQARRLQALLAFKEQFISQTVAAQVIGSSGSEQSRSLYIDKGTRDGIKVDMAVITVDGVVGKVLRVFHSTSLVLLVNDQSSGVGAILEKSRLQGVVRGTPAGDVVLERVMSDEQVQPGETVLTSGGDRIFPKGLPVGMVTRVNPGSELFLNIRVKPAANLSKLEEVLVVTKIEEKTATPSETGPVRAVDILAQRLPSVPDKPAAADPNKGAAGTLPSAQSGRAQLEGKPAGTLSGSNPNVTAATAPPSKPGQAVPAGAGTPAKAATGTAPDSAMPKPSGSAPGSDPASKSVTGSTPATGAHVNKPAAVPAGSGLPKPGNAAPAAVKPATAQKPAPPAVKASDPSVNPAAQTPTQTTPPQDTPQ